MPKIFEYLSIAFFFYANEHDPIHVHARKGGEETIFEIILYEGKISEIKTRKSKGRNHLSKTDKKNALEFVDKYAEDIVQKWVDFFVYRKTVSCDKITKKL